MTKKRRAVAPKYLRLETRRWFRNVADDWLGLEAHHIRLLVLACQAWDRGELARETLATEGLTVKNRFGEPKAHPAAGIARDATIAFARLLRELDLDVDPPVAESRPPALRSIAR